MRPAALRAAGRVFQNTVVFVFVTTVTFVLVTIVTFVFVTTITFQFVNLGNKITNLPFIQEYCEDIYTCYRIITNTRLNS